MKNALYFLLGIFMFSLFACKTKDVNKLPKKQYVNNQYKELKDLLPEAQVSIINDTIKVLFPNNLLFSTNEFKMNESTYLLMERFANCLNKYNKTTIIVSGHTDNVGKSEYNQELSRKRAESAMDLLIEFSVNKSRLHSWGFGDRQPLVENDTEENRMLNRRVEFIILIDDDSLFKK